MVSETGAPSSEDNVDVSGHYCGVVGTKIKVM